MNAFAARGTVAKQDVSGGGTKVTESTTNSLIDAECSDSYFGCMDAFCMVENVSGGRCQCSDKHATLSQQLNDLLKKQEDAENISKYGADFVKIANVESDIADITNNAKKKTVKPEKTETKKTLSRADWDAMFAQNNDDDEDFESEEFVDNDDIGNKHGDELYVAADEMCFEQTPSKCKSNGDMLKLMYAQKIKSDCAAFENSVKKQTSEINVQILDAQNAVRDAALSELENSNKYNLGQCVREFKICMQTTAGCGSDFGGCVLLSANENVSDNAKNISINGDLVDTLISASTMDNLISKKVLCESVLDNCVAVKDNVWDAFIRDVAPVVKTAELNAEEELRSKCVTTVADCYVKSCREQFDENEEGGSYDMCLSRPENYKSFCKVELEPCLAATGGSYDDPSKSRLWNGILARLASLRADACKKEFTACIQDDERCGEDYSKCIGLDENDVAMLCPDDKLTACYHEYEGKKETVRETLANIARGIFLQIHSGLAEACDNAVKDAMIKTCGNAENCNELVVSDKVGSRTLDLKFCEVYGDNNMYENCKSTTKEITDTELGKTLRDYSDLSKKTNDKHIYTALVIGNIMWGQITALPDYSGVISGDEYIEKVKDLVFMDEKTKEKVKTEVGAISNAIKSTISTLESDPRVQFCMTGRQVAGLTGKDGFQQYVGKSDNATFPNITQSARIAIVNGALLAAQKNYNAKYDELIKGAVDGTAQLESRYAQINKENIHLDEQDTARRKCMELGEWGAISSKTGGVSAKNEIVRDKGNDGKLVGYSSESTYNFKRQVTTNFNMDKMICTKCTRTQECEKTKSDYCKKWGEEKETCEEIQY
jgi:hypothetical protein